MMEFSILDRTFYFLTEGRQWEKLIEYLDTHLKWSLPTQIFLIISVIYLLFAIFSKILKKRKLARVLAKGIVLYYFLFLVLFCVLNNNEGVRELRLHWNSWFVADSGFHETSILLAIVNILIYLPYGYFMYSAIGRKYGIGYAVLLIVDTSVAIEALQFVLARGVTSIEEIVENSIGGLIGLLLGLLINKIRHA